ncbi:MAG: phosphotransferase [Acutalibacter sp.]|nr:phosphotransferase [Acutalibacter sp.]
MTENDTLKPSEQFPKEMEAPKRVDILSELSKFGKNGANTIELIDSTHTAADVRLNYIIDKKWVLRFCNAPDMTERRMVDLSRLIRRYQVMGLKCPQFIADDNGKYLHPWKQLLCYLSEYVDLPLAGNVELKDVDQLNRQVRESVALFAETYRDVDLSETMGMYSLFELSPLDIPNGIDEKQDNFNQLIRLLRSEGEDELANRLEIRHTDIRRKLQAIYRELPRCVFQADENFSNVLIDDAQHFAGFIDFNLAGTEVIINQLVNLAGFDYDEKQTAPEGAEARLELAIRHFQNHMSRMLQVYRATEKEQQALIWYAWIVMVAQWPNFCLFEKAIHDGTLKEEICELPSLIADLPEERLSVRVSEVENRREP